MARDPVCGMEINEAAARAEASQTIHGASVLAADKGTRRFHDGKWYYFCGVDCRSKFMANPQAYLKQAGN